MKRITLISFAIGLALSALSCSDDDLMYNVHQKRSVYFDRESKTDTIFSLLFRLKGMTTITVSRSG